MLSSVALLHAQGQSVRDPQLFMSHAVHMYMQTHFVQAETAHFVTSTSNTQQLTGEVTDSSVYWTDRWM